jgi:methoxymalonate biosynthesis acyl carrier protein
VEKKNNCELKLSHQGQIVMNEIKKQIVQILRDVRPEIQIDIDKDTELFGVLDSLDIIMLVDEIEKQMNVTIEAEQIIPENFASLHVLEAFIRSRAK